MGKLIIVTAPSGAGKTTIVRHLLAEYDQLAFSVSATTRPQRSLEVEGRDYYFMSVPAFKKLADEGAFLEWEEVYDNQFYGTLKKEVKRLWQSNKHVVFDIDVQGAVKLKDVFPDRTLTIFIKPPSPNILADRLRKRRSESQKSLEKRLDKAKFELSFEKKFDIVLVNDVLEDALKQAEQIIEKFILPAAEKQIETS